MSATLPALLDCRALADELNITEAAALAIMRKLPKVQVDGLRKVYVKRDDVSDLLSRSTKS